MPRARMSDVPELLQLIADEAAHFPPVPTREQLMSKVLQDKVVFFLGVMIITTPYSSGPKQGEYSYSGPCVYISHFASRTKGKGLATKVLLTFLMENRARTVFLNVFADNQPARALYEKCGLKLQGVHQYKGRDVARYFRPRSS